MTSKTKVEFWLDPLCPWAWITSRWIIEVSAVREIEVRWNVFSLAHLNREKEASDEYKQSMIASWAPLRTLMATKQSVGNDGVHALYTALGLRTHVNKEERDRSVISRSLADAKLPADLINSCDDASLDSLIIESHDRGIALVGNDVGTPIISVNSTAIFGPVISPAPKGEEAGKLWDGVLVCASYPGFFELKRSRTVGPIF